MDRCLKVSPTRSKRPQLLLVLQAACLLLVIGLSNHFSVLTQPPDVPGREAAAGDDIGILMTDASTSAESADEETMIELQDLSEARQGFGSGFVIPGYIPPGFSLSGISAYGRTALDITRVEAFYINGDRTIQIIEAKDQQVEDLPGLQTVQSGDKVWYIRVSDEGSGLSYIHLHRKENNIYYSISGNLDKNEIVQIAEAFN